MPAVNADFHPLGLLGKITAKPCLIEPFRNPPNKIELQTGIQKLFTPRLSSFFMNGAQASILKERNPNGLFINS